MRARLKEEEAEEKKNRTELTLFYCDGGDKGLCCIV